MIRFLSTSVLFLLLVSCSFAQDSPLRILEKPRPALPENYGTLCAQGTVRLKIHFLETGEIGRIFPISRMPVASLTELAIAAAQRIKFEPKKMGGRAVSAFGTIEYYYQAGWERSTENDPRAEAVLAKAIQNLGGERYLNVRSQIGRGKFSVIKEGVVVSFQTFVDVIVYPDKERTDFKAGGVKSVQTNVGESGWVFDGDQDMVKVQNEKQIADFKRGMRTSLDYLLRGHWRGDAELSYVGRRAATLGRRNEVVKLTFKDGFVVEYEFAAEDGLPQKGTHTRLNADKEEIKEEDRYAQFVDVGGIKTPFIIDRFTGGTQSSRINYQSVEHNKSIPDAIFAKPSSAKEVKKDLKL